MEKVLDNILYGTKFSKKNTVYRFSLMPKRNGALEASTVQTEILLQLIQNELKKYNLYKKATL